MVGRSFIYNINCPYCNLEINHNSYDDMTSYRYNDDEVVEEICPKCKNKFLVKLDKHIISKIDYEHAYSYMKEHYSYMNINERFFNELKERNMFVTNKEDLCIKDYNRDDLSVIMY